MGVQVEEGSAKTVVVAVTVTTEGVGVVSASSLGMGAVTVSSNVDAESSFIAALIMVKILG